MEIIDIMKSKEIIESGYIEEKDIPLIIEYVNHLEIITKETLEKMDIANKASKQLMKGFEILKEKNFGSREEFEKLKQKLDTSRWDAGMESTYYAFFLHGWNGRTNNGIYQ